MTESWEDHEDREVIDKWRKEKIKLTTENGQSMWISRRVLCTMINALDSESTEPREEEFDTKFVPGKGWDPPIEIWRKEGERARERTDDEVICHYDDKKGRTLGERRKYRKECSSASKQMEEIFDMCPREMCPMEHCSAHC